MSDPIERPGRVNALAPILLLGLAGVAILLRIPSIAQPLGIDQSLWASAVRGMERGQRLYVDVWEQRPPGIYLTYWAAFSAFGWTPAALALLDIAASALTAGALYFLARTGAGRLAGAATAAVYAVLTMPAVLYGHGGFLERSVSETFIVNCVALAAVCGAMYRRRPSLLAAFGLGVWIGLAVVFKPNAAIYFPALLMWALAGVRRDVQTVRSSLPSILAAVTGAAVVPIVVLVWLWRADALSEAKIAVVDFNRWYVAGGFNLPEYAATFYDKVGLRIKTEPLWLAGVVGSMVAVWDLLRRRRLRSSATLALFWGGAAALVIIVNGMRLYNSYFVQVLAPLSLVAGWWLTDAWSRSRFRQILAAGTLVLMAGMFVRGHYFERVVTDVVEDTAQLRGRADVHAYLERFGSYANGRGYSARANAELAAYVREHTSVDDRIFVFGINGAGVYFLADRLTAHRFLRVNFFLPTDFPDPRFTLDSVVADLGARQPAYLIFERLHSTADPAVARAVDALPDHPAVRSLLANYTLETTIEDFTLYRLK